MKRSAVVTIWIGALSAILVLSLQRLGLLARPEAILDHTLFGEGISHNGIDSGNYLLVVGLGFAVGWTMLQVAELSRRGLLLALLLVELLGAAWVISLGGVFFQPLPGILVAVVATALAALTDVTGAGQQRRALAALFRGRLSGRGISRLTEGVLPDLSAPQTREVTFVFCEIANQAELIDELPAVDCARLTNDFIRLGTELFLEQGGYLHGADGEGIRVVFGFPLAAPDHAAAAARAALLFRDRVAVLAFREPDSLGKIDLRIGVAAGPVVATVPEEVEGRRDVVISGEPVELARRLALANKIYGSRILLGPRAFSEAGAEIVARPIDFLRSGEAHERLEVYELLALGAEASAEEIACRDRFWTGLVYFRERRWAEAFTEFNRARRSDVALDEPLQWYLRRLEPLILHMATEPAPVPDPLAPL